MSKYKKAKCVHCKKKFEYYPKATRGKYCSNKCRIEHIKKGEWRKCKVCGKKFYIKKFAIKRGRGKLCSKKCYYKYIKTDEYRELLSQATSIIDIKYRPDLIRKRWRSRRWSKEIIARDKICQECGSRDNLHAHHIKSAMKYPHLIYRRSNGITLCNICHMKIERKNNKWSR